MNRARFGRQKAVEDIVKRLTEILSSSNFYISRNGITTLATEVLLRRISRYMHILVC